MRSLPILVLLFIALCFATTLQAQQTQVSSTATTAASSPVPRLIKFSGTLLDEQGRPMNSPAGVTFALYSQQSGSAALWMETQNVEVDAKGNYTVLLGANSATGIPADLFSTGEARWLGVQVERQSEQPRVVLVSVPYALKAGDAETLGGLPPSAFARAGNSAAESSNAASSSSLLLPVPAPATSSFNASTDPTVTTLGGMVNFVPKFDTASDVKTSQIFDNGTNVGVGFAVTPSPIPVAKLDINGTANIRGTLQLPATGTANSTTKGFNSQPFDYLASVFNGTAAVNQHFRWQAEPVNPGLSTASGKLNLLFASGIGTPGETGLSINNKGQITFAPGQTFPTVTGNETITGNETVNGTVSGSQLISTAAKGTAPLKVTSTTQVPNLNASLLDGLSASAFASIGTNKFLGSQFVPGGGSGLVGIGDASCGAGFGAIGFGVNGLNSCTNWSLLGDGINTVIGRPANGAVFFELAGSGQSDMMVDSSGVVAIGTTTQNDQSQLEVDAATGTGRHGIRAVGADFATGRAGFGLLAQGGNGTAPFVGGAGVVAVGGTGQGDGVVAQGGSNALLGGTGGIGIRATGGTNGDGSVSLAAFLNGDVDVSGCLSVSAGRAGAVQFGSCLSDVRLKRNIEAFPAVLEKVVQLQPVTYNWRTEEYPQFRFSSGRVLGLIAQEVEKVFPDMVSTDQAGYRRVNYGELPYLMLQAIRELNAEKDKLQHENLRTNTEIRQLTEELRREQSHMAELEGRLTRIEGKNKGSQERTQTQKPR